MPVSLKDIFLKAGLWSLFLFSAMGLQAQATYSFAFKNHPLQAALEEIAAVSAHQLYFSSSQVDLDRPLTYSCNSQPLEVILAAILHPMEIDFELADGGIYLMKGQAKGATLQVVVKDGQDSSLIEGAQVTILNPTQRRSTGETGEAVFESLPAQGLIVEVTRLGYKDSLLTIDFSKGEDRSIAIFLSDQALLLNKVVIAQDQIHELAGPSHSQLSSTTLKAVQGVYEDPLAVIRLLPGIASQQSLYLNPGLYIRGGEPEENLTLLDNIRLPTPILLTGRSIINPDFIDQAEVLTGGISPRYGNHLSGVMNFKTRNGAMDTWSGKLRQSLWNSQVGVEGPLVKDKLSALFMARRSTFDWLWPVDEAAFPVTLDVDFKLYFKASNKHRFSLTNVYVAEDFLLNQGQSSNGLAAKERIQAQSFQWQYVPSTKLYSKFSVLRGASRVEIQENNRNLFYRIRQQEIGFREDVYWQPWEKHFVKAGLAAEWENSSGQRRLYHEATDHAVSDSSDLLLAQSLDAQVPRAKGYAMLQGKLTKCLGYLAGLRVDHNVSYGWTQVSPRASFDLQAMDWLQLNISSGLYRQDPAPHLPRLFPGLRPGKALHHSLGWRLGRGSLRGMLEGYWKTLEELVVFDRNGEFSNAGEGNAMGVEGSMEWRNKRWATMANYSFGRSNRRRHLQDRVYPFHYEQQHMFNAFFIFRPQHPRKVIPSQVGADFRFATGRPITPATGVISTTGQQILLWGEVNSARLPVSHSLNLRIEWEAPFRNPAQGGLSWYLSIWNLYGYPNPIGIAYTPHPDLPGQVLAAQQSSLPFFFDLGLVMAIGKKM